MFSLNSPHNLHQHRHRSESFPSDELPPCSQGHRLSLSLPTSEGGSICLVCFSNLISTPTSPTFHVSYALLQLSDALTYAPFLQSVLRFHSHFLTSSLIQALSSFDDEPIARQITDLVVRLCDSGSEELYGDFLTRVSHQLSLGTLAWSRRQVYMLHCFGLLLKLQQKNPCDHINNIYALLSNLILGLKLPSEEIQGEIMFVLYKLSILPDTFMDGDRTDALITFCPELLHLSLEVLMKTQHDDVRVNCVAFLTVLVQRGYFGNNFLNDIRSSVTCEDDNFMETKNGTDGCSLDISFAEAIKSPLLSSDSQVQLGTLKLLFHYMSSEGVQAKQIQCIVEESIADYVFEILRLSDCKDETVGICIQVLELLSTAEQAFRKRLAVGFLTLIPVLRHVAEVPFHPVQTQLLNLVLDCISHCPGVASISHVEEICAILSGLFERHKEGEIGMLPETFNLACLIFSAIVKCPSSRAAPNLASSLQVASRHSVLSCLSVFIEQPTQLLHSLYLLKEAYAYSHGEISDESCTTELGNSIVNLCKEHLLPWFSGALNLMEKEDIVLGILETFHSILLEGPDVKAMEFVEFLVSSSWFGISFECLGLFPTEKMKWRVYLMFSSMVDALLGNDFGQSVRDAAPYLPPDPMDLLFLLGQKSSQNMELSSCHSAILRMLYLTSLYDEKLADDKLVLASLEQYILVNSDIFLLASADSGTRVPLVNLYALYRGLAKISYQIPYSSEAERVIFQLLVEKQCDIFSTKIHTTALKWLFQQEKICDHLSNQILQSCRKCNSSGSNFIDTEKSSQNRELLAIAELVAAGDNYAAMLTVCLLKQLMEEESREDDIMSVLSFLALIVETYPSASNQLCLHGIGNAIKSLYYRLNKFPPEKFMTISVLVFNILRSAQPETLSDDEDWLAMTIKLMDYLIPMVVAEGWTEESLLVIGIFCMILHHSCKGTLVEASRIILLNTSMVTVIDNTIQAACSKGPALMDDEDEEENTDAAIIFVLLLHYFMFSSVHSVLPDFLDWQNLLDSSKKNHPLCLVRIHCHDLCKLLHFGSPSVKLIASHILFVLLTRISDQMSRKHEEPRCSAGYLRSVSAVLEGLVFHHENRVATNCGLCLSIILGWEKDGEDARIIGKRHSWCRLVVEELAMSLAVPSLPSKSFANHHKPAAHVGVALLRLRAVPEWMSSVFDESCVSGIIKNLSAGNLTIEIVVLFRELLRLGYLNVDQIGNVSRLFQTCRKQMYAGNAEDDCRKEHLNATVTSSDLEKVCEFLVQSMSSLGVDFAGQRRDSKRFIEEIELFFMTSTEVGTIGRERERGTSRISLDREECVRNRITDQNSSFVQSLSSRSI